MDASGIGRPLSDRLRTSPGVMAGGLIASLCLIWPSSMPQAESKAPQTPMEVTSDTPEYCLELADRVNNLVEVSQSKPPQQVADLQVQGKEMCEHGQTRGGIMRLRQAILLMKHGDQATNP
jgi:hypothetical protein